MAGLRANCSEPSCLRRVTDRGAFVDKKSAFGISYMRKEILCWSGDHTAGKSPGGLAFGHSNNGSSSVSPTSTHLARCSPGQQEIAVLASARCDPGRPSGNGRAKGGSDGLLRPGGLIPASRG